MRTQGELVTRTRYDTSGRLAGKAIHYRDAPAEVLPLLDKAYRYDASDNLVAEVLTQTQRRGMTNAANDENAHLEQIIGRFHDLPHRGKTYSGRNRYGYDLNERLQIVQQSRPNWQATRTADQSGLSDSASQAVGRDHLNCELNGQSLDKSHQFPGHDRQKPDRVILDLMLQGIDGLQLCRLLRHEVLSLERVPPDPLDLNELSRGKPCGLV